MSETPAAPEQWRRTSPRGFVVQAIVALRGLILPLAAGLYGSRSEWEHAPWLLMPLAAALVALSAGISFVAWRKQRYRLGEADIRVERGIVSRSARSVPYERIQDVSLEQSLIPRLFGLVEVRFETGAGGKDELKLAYVSEAQGAALRETVRDAVRNRRATEEGAAGEAPAPVASESPRLLFAMDRRRLAMFGVFEFSLIVVAVLAGASQQLEFLLPFDIWEVETWSELGAGSGHGLAELGLAAQLLGLAGALGALAIVGLATGLTRTILRDYGFLLEQTPKGLRRRRGLLTRTDMIMPLARVQALVVTTGLVRRLFGWHGLEVISLASDARSGSHVVVPFARLEEIAPVVETAGLVLPAPSTPWRRASPRHYLDRAVLVAAPLSAGALGAGGLAMVNPATAGWASVMAAGLLALAGLVIVRQRYLWRHDRYALQQGLVLVRRGWLSPRLDVAPRVKLQSVEIVQGPLARRRGYADFRLGLAGGTLQLRGLGLADAGAVRAAVLASVAAVDFSRLAR